MPAADSGVYQIPPVLLAFIDFEVNARLCLGIALSQGVRHSS